MISTRVSFPPSPPQPPPHLSPMSNSPPPASAVTVAADAPLPPPRKFPAPCWTPDETEALITVYKDKWYSLRCRNLRSLDWDAVAADLLARSPPSAAPAKTSAQCRHKMEKLRRRYRALNHPNRSFTSSWLFFDLMASLETGSCSSLKVAKEDDSRKFDANIPRDLSAVPIKFKFKSHGYAVPSDREEDERYGECDSRSRPSDRHPVYSDSRLDSIPNSGFRKKGKRGGAMMMDLEEACSVVSEMVGSIRMLGEGLVRMEKTKVEMVREMERMRMEMEMKRCEMILESQQFIVDAFVEGIGGDTPRKKKKVKLVE